MGYFGIPFRNGVPIGLGSVVSFGAQQFDPSELFVGGTAGAWYDPSDLSTMFTTSAGTTQCAMPGQGSAVSVGLMLDKSKNLALGPELIANPDFTTDTWWIKGAGCTIAGGLGVATSAPNGSGFYKLGLLTSGAYYEITFTIVSISSGAFRTKFFSTNTSPSYNAPGTYTVRLLADTADFVVETVGTTTGTIDSVSVKQVSGNHAIAANDSTKRPELSARVNLLVATATLSTQNVTTQATSYTLSFAGTGSITLSGTATGSYNAGTHTITCTAGTLTLTVSGTVTTADLRPANSGALLPAYQAVVDAHTYDTSGFPLYLLFDGADDSMYTPANLNLSGTDKVAVFAGVRKLATTNAAGVIAELTSSWFSNAGTFVLYAPDGDAQNFGWGTRGNANTPYVAPLAATQTSYVATGAGDISGDVAQLRLNGAVAATSTTDQGTGNFGSYPLFIGARNNSSVWFNGHLHSLIIAGSAVGASNISATEQWVAGKTGIVIP